MTRLGLAVGPHRLVAVRAGRAPVERPLTPPGDGDTWPALTEALRDVAREMGGRAGRVSVALLRPLAQAKVVRLPPVGRRELRALAARTARRHFLIGNDPVVADAAGTGPRRRGAPLPALTVCAPERLLRQVEGSIREAGWRLDVMTSGAVALTLAARARGRVVLLALGPDWMEGIAADGNAIRLVEPVSPRAAVDLGAFAARLAAAAWGEEAGAAVRTIEERDPAARAALGAALISEDAPLLLTEPARRALSLRMARRVAALGAVTACLLGAAAALRLWGLEREIQAVARERRAHAAGVAELVSLQRDGAAVRARLAALARIESERPRWTPVLAALAQALPDSAYLLSFTARGPRVQLTGMAHSASAVVAALEESPRWRGAALAGAQRRGSEAGGEFFDVMLSVQADSAAP